MIIVADYAFQHPTIAQLQAAGVKAVGRYFGQDTTSDGKNLTRAEAESLSAAGIEIFSLFEYGAQQATGGAAQAAKDVALARGQRQQVGMAWGRPWYFSVDFDIPDYAPGLADVPANALKKLGPVGEYFTWIRDHMGTAHTGIYGGYWAVKRALDAALVGWAFQTTAWSGGQWDARACLRQTGQTALGGVADLDTPERTDFGQWKVGAQPPPEKQYVVVGLPGGSISQMHSGQTLP